MKVLSGAVAVLAAAMVLSSAHAQTAPITPSQPVTAEAPKSDLLDLNTLPHWSGDKAVKVQAFSTQVIYGPEEWANVWAMVGDRPPEGVMKQGQRAVAIFLGNRYGRGYLVRISEIKHLPNDDLVVKYIEIKPEKAALPPAGQAIDEYNTFSPWVIKMMPATSGRIRFVKASTPR